MPGFLVEVSPSFRDVLGRFAKADKALLDDKRKTMRELGAHWVTLAREEAPKGKTGKFRKGISYKTFVRGEVVEMKTYSPQPLGAWIAFGTKPHKISANKAGALAFYWPKVGAQTIVPKRGFPFTGHMKSGDFMIGKGYVQHPGTKPNPYHTRATKRWRPRAYVQLRQLALNYKTRVLR